MYSCSLCGSTNPLHACKGRISSATPATDPVNPAHYHGDYVMRIIEDFGLDFLDGQVVKYMLRSGHKPGEPAGRDYEKALWYLQRKIENLKKSQPALDSASPEQFSTVQTKEGTA